MNSAMSHRYREQGSVPNCRACCAPAAIVAQQGKLPKPLCVDRPAWFFERNRK